jgi:hypothetical protein
MAETPALEATGPVYSLNQNKDVAYCQGVIPAGKLYDIVPRGGKGPGAENLANTRHNVNRHYNAREAFRWMLKFMETLEE